MNKSWGRAVVALSIAAVGLSACGDEAEPGGTPTESPSVTSSGSASPSTTGSASSSPSATSSTAAPSASVPAAARARTEAGAIAFLNFYFDQVNRGLLNPTSAPNLFEIADQGCVACKNGQDLFAEYASGGWSLKQSGIRVANPALANEVSEDRVIINFTFVEASQPLYQNGKKTSHKVPAATTKKGAALKWVNGAWQMYGIENL